MMKKISCIAIDDEPIALLIIRQFCERKGGLELTAFSEPLIGLQEIGRCKPDLVFLDIEMNSTSGLDIAHALPPESCLIFTTAHAQYALTTASPGGRCSGWLRCTAGWKPGARARSRYFTGCVRSAYAAWRLPWPLCAEGTGPDIGQKGEKTS